MEEVQTSATPQQGEENRKLHVLTFGTAFDVNSIRPHFDGTYLGGMSQCPPFLIPSVSAQVQDYFCLLQHQSALTKPYKQKSVRKVFIWPRKGTDTAMLDVEASVPQLGISTSFCCFLYQSPSTTMKSDLSYVTVTFVTSHTVICYGRQFFLSWLIVSHVLFSERNLRQESA